MSASVHRLIVGLGNPGRDYERTRHNAGFLAVEAAAQAWGWAWVGTMRSGGSDVARYAQGALDGVTVRLIEPLTFMNLSGTAIGPFIRRHAIPPADVLVICDEAHLPVGRLRLRAEGTGGGHHGLDSMVEALGTEAFPRLRIGVGREPLPEDLATFVLGRWPEDEWTRLQAIQPRIVETCEWWMTRGIESAMSFCNREEKERTA